MDKNRISGASVDETSGQLTAKSISIKEAQRRSGDCARKAAELTPGDLPCVASATGVAEGSLIAGQKSAEGIVDHVVGQASEALRLPKVESTDRPGTVAEGPNERRASRL